MQADHLPFFNSNHSRLVAATITTASTDHGDEDVGSSLGVVVVGFASGDFGVLGFTGTTTLGVWGGVVAFVFASAAAFGNLGGGNFSQKSAGKNDFS